MSLIMTLLVRDEQDILEANMRYHLETGVDHIIVTDNLSVDSTADIIDDFVRQGVATYIYEPHDTYSQARWVTRMAHVARENIGAKWVVHSDADEFWMTPDAQDLKSYFENIKFYNVVEAPRHDFICLEGDDTPFWQRMIYRKNKSLNSLGQPLPPKIAHRALAGIKVEQGNHGISGLQGKRQTKSKLEILHFPLRSQKQYLQKIRNGGKSYANNTELSQAVGSTWRKQYAELRETGKLKFVENNIVSPQACERMLAQGDICQDTRLYDFFAAASGQPV